MLRMQIIYSVLIYGLIGTIGATFSRTGFLSNYINDWKCKLSHMDKVDGSDSIIESYYNKSGDFCKIYCRVRKIKSPEVEYFTLNAPEFSVCGPLKFCHFGECGPCLVGRIVRNSFKELISNINKRPNDVTLNEERDGKVEPRIESSDKNGTQIEREGKPSGAPIKRNAPIYKLYPGHTQGTLDVYNVNNGKEQGNDFDWENVPRAKMNRGLSSLYYPME